MTAAEKRAKEIINQDAPTTSWEVMQLQVTLREEGKGRLANLLGCVR